jgi:hypothetical protein
MPKLKVKTADLDQVRRAGPELEALAAQDLALLKAQHVHYQKIVSTLSDDALVSVWVTDTYFASILSYALQFTTAAELARATGFSAVQIGRWVQGGAPQLAVRKMIFAALGEILAAQKADWEARLAAAQARLHELTGKPQNG